ncbi:MAG: cupin domain-containing protein [Proteobacteria bacterium]|nr:cupin domain-containing protein [Pseudomonadota bacterium]MBS0464131.1 cupin domain-containing protein [Pseudomonadota bacterium]
MRNDALPEPITPAPDPVDPTAEVLLAEPFASAWATDAAGAADIARDVRNRLLERLAASRREASTMFTRRLNHAPGIQLAPGVVAKTLYTAGHHRPLRAGEPLCARIIELAAGARWSGPDSDSHREWLVLRGSVRIGAVDLTLRDYHVQPMGAAGGGLACAHATRLFLRQSDCVALPGDAPSTVRDAQAGWPEFAPGIRRRVLWQRGDEAALLYNARAGAAVPLHTHGHDEECLMVQGELYLDDLLLQEGDYQLAPAGTGHRVTQTDTGVVIYAHGDMDFRFVA